MDTIRDTITPPRRIFKAGMWPRPIPWRHPQVARPVGILFLPKAVAVRSPVTAPAGVDSVAPGQEFLRE